VSDQLFGRNVKVRIFATSIGIDNNVPQITYDKGYTEFGSVQPNGQSGYRIRGRCIQVQPTIGFNTNQINVSLYNLGPVSRAIVQAKVGTKMTIFAGYGLNPKQIALGDILWARTHKEGPDYITEVVAGDSHFALTNGQINTSFKGPTSYQTIVNAILAKLEESQLYSGVVNLPVGGVQNGIVLSGSPLDELARVCKLMNRTMSVVGGGINILPYGQDIGSPIIELSEKTGLIGIPEIQPPGPIGVVPTTLQVSPDLDLSFVHLLRADLVLSQKVRIISKFVNGEYVILRNVYDFDSWIGPFYNRCECQKVQVASGG
jgi:hypothetical protein